MIDYIEADGETVGATVTAENAPEETALIRVVQLPIIVDRLSELKTKIQAAVAENKSLACSPETLQVVKEARSSMNRKFRELEELRMTVKRSVLEPYEQFEAVYKDCVSDQFKDADKDMKAKISAVESGIIDQAAGVARAYFAELIAREVSNGNDLEWLAFDALNIKIGLTEAKQKTLKAVKTAVSDRVNHIAADVVAIAEQEHAPEIMAEYKLTLDLPRSIAKIAERHRRIEEENRRAQELSAQRAEAQARAAAVAACVQTAPVAAPAAAVPAPAPVVCNPPAPDPIPTQAPAAPTKDPNEILSVKFSVTGPRCKLHDFKQRLIEYCEKEGISYGN